MCRCSSLLNHLQAAAELILQWLVWRTWRYRNQFTIPHSALGMSFFWFWTKVSCTSLWKVQADQLQCSSFVDSKKLERSEEVQEHLQTYVVSWMCRVTKTSLKIHHCLEIPWEVREMQLHVMSVGTFMDNVACKFGQYCSVLCFLLHRVRVIKWLLWSAAIKSLHLNQFS